MPLHKNGSSAVNAIFGAPILTLVFSLGLAAPALAGINPAECGSPPATVVNVEPVFDDVQYEFYKPMTYIKSMADADSPHHQREQWPVGLSTGELFVRMATEIQTRHMRAGTASCGSLKSVTVRLGFTNNTIYVAKEFPRRSCPHRTVLQHEERHKMVDRQLLEEYAEKVRYMFGNLSQQLGILADTSSGMVEAEFNGRLNTELKKFTDAMSAERARRQAAVDTETEYARVSASCDGQLMEVVNQRLDLIRSSEPSFAARVGAAPPPPAPAAQPLSSGSTPYGSAPTPPVMPLTPQQ
jgi:hypothetical protein